MFVSISKCFWLLFPYHSFFARFFLDSKMHTGSDWVAAVKQAETVKPAEPVQPNQTEEKIDLDEIEEEIEEVKEIEEVAEEEEKVVEGEETGEMIEQNVIADGADICSNVDIDTKEAETRAALLACPPHGSQIRINGISSDISKEDLKIFCGSVGQVTRVNICERWGSSKNVYLAFVEYKSNELAAKAVQELNDTVLKGKKVSCYRVYSKRSLLIGNIPRSMTKDVLMETLEKIGPGVNCATLNMESSVHRNRGFAYAKYYNYACANHSRIKMSDPKFKLGNGLTAIWAAKGRTVFVRNLPNNVTQDQLRSLFGHHGEITKVVLPPAKFGRVYSIGFVQFAKVSSTRRALSEKYHLDGRALTCTFAIPRFGKRDATKPNAQGPLLQNIPSQMGYGDMEGAPRYASGYGVRGGAYSAPRYTSKYGVRGDAYNASGYVPRYGVRGDAYSAPRYVPRYGVRGDTYSAPRYVPRYDVRGDAYSAPGYIPRYGVRGPRYVSGYGVRGGAYSAPGYDVRGGAYSASGYTPGYGVRGGAHSAPGYDVRGGAYSASGYTPGYGVRDVADGAPDLM